MQKAEVIRGNRLEAVFISQEVVINRLAGNVLEANVPTLTQTDILVSSLSVTKILKLQCQLLFENSQLTSFYV